MPSPQVLAVHRYFWPDAPPYAAMLRNIAGRWGRDGADVAVVTAQPSYRGGQHKRPAREAIDGFQVRRVPAVAGKGARAAVDLVAFPLTVAPGGRITFAGSATDDTRLANVEIQLQNSTTREKLASDGTWSTDSILG